MNLIIKISSFIFLFFLIFLIINPGKSHAQAVPKPGSFPNHCSPYWQSQPGVLTNPSLFIGFYDTDPGTRWGVRARYDSSRYGSTGWRFSTSYWTSPVPNTSLAFIFACYQPNVLGSDTVTWQTACADPPLDVVAVSSCSYRGSSLSCELQDDFNVSCNTSRGIRFRACAGTDNRGLIPWDAICPNQQYCATRGLIAAGTCPRGVTYCGTTVAQRCNTVRNTCSWNGSVPVCGTRTINTNVRSCIGTGGCQCILNTDCTNRCGTGAYNQCHFQTRRCNSVHQCYVAATSYRDARCRATNGTTGDVCSYNSDCRQSTHYCRRHTTGTCGVCRPYDEIVGRVFVDRNHTNASGNAAAGRNNWDAGIDEGIGGVSVQRRNFNISTWQSTRTTNPNGWFVWNRLDPYSERLRNVPNQDVRTGRWQYDTACLYRDIIRSRYGGIGTVQTTPGNRRDNIDPSPNPTSVLFILRHKSYSIYGQVRKDDGDGNMYEADGVTLDAGDAPLTGSPTVRIRTLDPDGSGFSADDLSSTGYYRLPDPSRSPGQPSTRYYVYGRTYEVQLLESTLPPGYAVIANTSGETGAGSNTMDVTIDQCTAGNSGPDNNNHFLVARVYSVSGYVFDDLNADGVLNGTEGKKPNLTGAVSTDYDPVPVNTDAAGDFFVGVLPEGDRRVNLAWTLPADWQATFPLSNAPGLPPGLTITLGEGPAPRPICSFTNYTNALSLFNGGSPTSSIACISGATATQNVGDIQNFSFGVRPTPPEPWLQGIGGDMRSDSSNSLANEIPTNNPPSLYGVNPNPFFSIGDLPTLEPGLAFGGGLTLGPGANDNNLLANSSFQYVNENFAPSSRKMSYDYVRGTLQGNGRIDGSTPSLCSASPSNCTLAPSAPIYDSSGDRTITSVNIPNSNEDYIIFIDGNLTISADIVVPNGTTLFIIVSGSITVSETVENIQGVYSAMTGFSVLGDTNANLNEQLNVEGSIISNGTFTNGRNLDFRNQITPSILIRFRPDFVLNAPELIRFTDYKISEIAPGTTEEDN